MSNTDPTRRRSLRRNALIAVRNPDLKIDVYPVGALAELARAWRYLTVRQFPASVGPPSWAWRVNRARASLRHIRQTVVRHVRARNWRALKNTFNGYLAEPFEFPPGDYRRRCGTGWTKAGALRSLDRRLPSGVTRPNPSQGGDAR